MKLWDEFKAFAFKGNMIDLALAVVIGGAFGGVVNSLVKDIIMPIVGHIVPNEAGYLGWKVWGIKIGSFLGELVNFLIIAAAVFLVIVKLVGSVVKKPEPPSGPPMKECPMCCSNIPVKARKCAHCTADLA
ncbi:MAG TPA: large conductance mechanosensitive channel protein MscL [Pirellulales bacterium]|jgi:large conductance mechanosensitive channel|nr:large conductance mechanosensitive channel protein MscL [Pirellulales bacterium]